MITSDKGSRLHRWIIHSKIEECLGKSKGSAASLVTYLNRTLVHVLGLSWVLEFFIRTGRRDYAYHIADLNLAITTS
jgi:hypothetical protein